MQEKFASKLRINLILYMIRIHRGDKMRQLFELMDDLFDEMRVSLRKRDFKEIGAKLESLEKDYDQLRNLVEREMKLSQIETELYTSPKSLDETLDHIANIIKNEFRFSRFDIVLVDHEQQRVMRRYAKGGFGEADFEKLSRHGALTVTRDYCLQNKEPWIVNDIKGQDPRWKLALELDVWIHGTFPLYQKKKDGREELVGYLHGARTKKDFLAGKLLTPKEVNELKRLGRAVTKAINDAKLSYFEHGVMKIQDIIGSTRIEISKLPEEIDEEETQDQMDRVLDVIIDTLDVTYGGILVNEQGAAVAFSFRSDKKESIPPGKIDVFPRPLTGIVSKALFDGFSVIENEVASKSEEMDLKIGGIDETIHTLIAVPLIESYSDEGVVKKNVIGVIVLINKKDYKGRLITTDEEGNEGGFTTLDKDVLEAISAHIETIISNTRSHRKLKQLSLTDGLTELANHTHFLNNLLTLEFKRSQRYGTPLSVLLLDIDHFKVFNDIFGHQVGDLVLQEVARILRENTRAVDHIARYGGEEFAVILHNTPLKDAIAYAEKIRNRISRGDYIRKIQEKNLFDVAEANKRFHAIIEMDDQKIKEAKVAIMNRHFDLNVQRIIDLLEEGRNSLAEKEILKAFKVTVSIGLAFYPDPRIYTKKDLVTTADMLLLKAKERGRNRVESMEI